MRKNKLNDFDIVLVYVLSNFSDIKGKELAERFNVHESVISRIKNKKRHFYNVEEMLLKNYNKVIEALYKYNLDNIALKLIDKYKMIKKEIAKKEIAKKEIAKKEIAKKEKKIVKISWEEYQNIINHFSKDLKRVLPNLDCILGIARGGMFPAMSLAYKLNIKNVEMINIETYDKNNKQLDSKKIDKRNSKELKKLKKIFKKYKTILIVDDITDTGLTFKLIEDYINSTEIKNKADYALFALFGKNNQANKISFFHQTIPENSWLEFPWD